MENEWRMNSFLAVLIEILKESSTHLGNMKIDHLREDPLAILNPLS